MELIYNRGLNCHLACVMSIANALGVRYQDAYANLWSETDFTYEEKYRICISKRIFVNLEAIGIRTRLLDCEEMNRDTTMPLIPNGEMFFVGMDTFDIPWHPVFGYFHGPHYFYAQKEAANSLLCFDPVYDEKYKLLKPETVLFHAFELGHVYRVDACPPTNPLPQEAAEVLRRHPETKAKLISDMLHCKDKKENILPLINQITAMINNRHLFRHYLKNTTLTAGTLKNFITEAFLNKWEAIRNGVYKASIMKDNKTVVDEVCGLFADLMDEEMAMAAALLRLYNHAR